MTPTRVYVLTLWQPWCGIMVWGEKGVENRPWRPKDPEQYLGQLVALHAGLQYDGDVEAFCRERMLPVPTQQIGGQPVTRISGAILGLGRIDGFHDNPLLLLKEQRRWFFGPWGFSMIERRPLPKPRPWTGARGLLRLPESVEAEMLECWRRAA